MLLEQLGIYGWKQAEENLLLASLLTGDPLLLIGNHGCAKTHVGHKVAQALGRSFLVYDASKCMFEDVLGYPNVEKLKQGKVEYIASPVTIWDKELVLIDELNRAVPELQSKWLEIIRSRKIMGFTTQVKWVWAAMNPLTYSGTQALDEALVGRFAYFLYPPDVLQMKEEDRIRVAMHINGDDAPSLGVWTEGVTGGTVPMKDVEEVGKKLRLVLQRSGNHFLHLREQWNTLAEFLAKFSELLTRETKGEVSLDGRRLGFIYRNILANRAIELAKAEVFQEALPSFAVSARNVVQSSLPVGLNDASLNREEAIHKMEICFDLLSGYFDEEAQIGKVNLVYELFTTQDLMRKAELLLQQDLGEMALSKAWTDLMAGSQKITLLAYTAAQVEARRPGTVPQELLATLATKIESGDLSTACVPRLENEAVEYIEEVERLLQRENDLEKLVAYQHVSALVSSGRVNLKTIRDADQAIAKDILKFEALLDAPKATERKAA